MKRFTATEKWDDIWFRKLSPHLKLLWFYICDRCDHAGIWNPDLEHAAYVIGSGQFLQKEAIEAFEGRVWVLDNGRWFIRKFPKFQYGDLNAANNCHKSVRSRLEELQILDLAYPSPTPQHPLSTPSGGAMVEREVQVQEKEGECEGKPKIETVLFEADRIGLAKWKATDWFNEMEGCGWLDHNKRMVVRWQNILARVKVKWEADGRPSGPPKSKFAVSPNGEKTILQKDVERRAMQIKRLCQE